MFLAQTRDDLRPAPGAGLLRHEPAPAIARRSPAENRSDTSASAGSIPIRKAPNVPSSYLCLPNVRSCARKMRTASCAATADRLRRCNAIPFRSNWESVSRRKSPDTYCCPHRRKAPHRARCRFRNYPKQPKSLSYRHYTPKRATLHPPTANCLAKSPSDRKTRHFPRCRSLIMRA